MNNFFRFLLLAAFCLLFHPLQAQMCLPSWLYRVPVTVNNAGNGALTNYQVKLTMNTAALVTAGKMRSDGGDIRFTGSDCCTPVCHWVEKGMNTATTVIWLKIPSLPAGGTATVYLHYGDLTQTSNANGDCVFEFFDDFSGTTLNLSKWTVRGTPAALTVSGGTMQLAGNSNWEYIRSNTTFTSKVKIHDRRSHGNSTGSAGFVFGHAGADNRYTFRYNSTNLGMAVTYDTDVFGGNAWYNQTYPLLPYAISPTYHEFEATAENVSNAIQITNYCNLTAANCNSNTTNLNSSTGASFYIGYSSYTSALGSSLSDHVFVRKFTATADPSTSLGSEFAMPPRPLATTPDGYLCEGTTRLLNAGAGHFSFLWNNAVTTQTQTFNFPPADTVWCTVVDGMGCSFTDTIIFTVSPLPANFISPVQATVCPGDSVTFDAGPSMDSYLWIGGPAAQTYTVALPGDYIAEVMDTLGCVGRDTASLLNFAPPPVAIMPGDSLIFCWGDSLDLDAGLYPLYQWSTGDSTQIITVDSSGLWWVEVTDSNGCTGIDSVLVTEVPLPAVSITPHDIIVCEGTQVCLDAGAGFGCYIWSEGSNTQVICPPVAGQYSVTVCDANNCMNSDTASVQFYPAPNAIITQAGNTFTCSPAVTYQWLLNNSPLGGGTSQSYTTVALGNYSCVITDSNGCTDTSNVISFTTSAVASSAPQVNLWPNPARDLVSLNVDGLSGKWDWELVSITGVSVVSGSSSSAEAQISTAALPRGMYLVVIRQEGGRWVQRLVLE